MRLLNWPVFPVVPKKKQVDSTSLMAVDTVIGKLLFA